MVVAISEGIAHCAECMPLLGTEHLVLRGGVHCHRLQCPHSRPPGMLINQPQWIQALAAPPVCTQPVEDIADIVVNAINMDFRGACAMRARLLPVFFTALDWLTASGIDAPQCQRINMIAHAEFYPQGGPDVPAVLNWSCTECWLRAAIRLALGDRPSRARSSGLCRLNRQ